jgi:hypothetical protein
MLAELRPEIAVEIKGDWSDERGKPTNEEDDPGSWELVNAEMNVAQRNTIGKLWLKKFRTLTVQGVSMRDPTRVEAKRIQDGGELPAYVAASVLPLYQRFAGCDFDAKDGAMEYCWHLIRKKAAELCSLTGICTPRKALTPEQTAVKLVTNEKTRVEWEIMKTPEWTMEEINWRVIDNRLKDEPRNLHDMGCLAVERDKRRDKLYKLILKLKSMIPEPKIEEMASVGGRDKPVDKPPPTTQEGLRKMAEKRERRKEELEIAFNMNWSVTGPKVIEKIAGSWKRRAVTCGSSVRSCAI